MKVIISDFISDDLLPEKKILSDLATVEALNGFTEEDLWGRIDDADAVMVYHNLSISAKTIGRLKHCKLIVRCGVGTDNVDGKFARERGIPMRVIESRGMEREAYDRLVIDELRTHDVDLVCLAGFMRLLSASFVQAFPGRVLNIHPSQIGRAHV